MMRYQLPNVQLAKAWQRADDSQFVQGRTLFAERPKIYNNYLKCMFT